MFVEGMLILGRGLKPKIQSKAKILYVVIIGKNHSTMHLNERFCRGLIYILLHVLLTNSCITNSIIPAPETFQIH